MKSQMSMEFLVGVTLLLFIYILAIGLFSSYTQHNIIETEAGKQICYTITTGVDAAVVGGKNFTLNVTIPNLLENTEYFVFISPVNTSIVTVDWDIGEFACSMITQNVTVLRFSPCRFSVNNLGGRIYLSTVSTDKLQYNFGENVNITGSHYLGTVNITIYKNSTVIQSVNATVTNNSFGYIWNPAEKGTYTISVYDTTNKNLNAERDIFIV